MCIPEKKFTKVSNPYRWLSLQRQRNGYISGRKDELRLHAGGLNPEAALIAANITHRHQHQHRQQTTYMYNHVTQTHMQMRFSEGGEQNIERQRKIKAKNRICLLLILCTLFCNNLQIPKKMCVFFNTFTSMCLVLFVFVSFLVSFTTFLRSIYYPYSSPQNTR